MTFRLIFSKRRHILELRKSSEVLQMSSSSSQRAKRHCENLFLIISFPSSSLLCCSHSPACFDYEQNSYKVIFILKCISAINQQCNSIIFQFCRLCLGPNNGKKWALKFLCVEQAANPPLPLSRVLSLFSVISLLRMALLISTLAP